MTTFEEEVLPHRKAAFGLAMKLTRFKEDAEELTQEALLRAWQGYLKGQYRPGMDGKRWLMRIVSNTVIGSKTKVSAPGGNRFNKPTLRPIHVSLTGWGSIRELKEALKHER